MLSEWANERARVNIDLFICAYLFSAERYIGFVISQAASQRKTLLVYSFVRSFAVLIWDSKKC